FFFFFFVDSDFTFFKIYNIFIACIIYVLHMHHNHEQGVTKKLEWSEFMEQQIVSDEGKQKETQQIEQIQKLEVQWTKERQELVQQAQQYEEQVKQYQAQTQKLQQELSQWNEKYEATQEQHQSRIDQITASSSEQVLKYTEKLHELVKDYEQRLKEKDESRSVEIQTMRHTLEALYIYTYMYIYSTIHDSLEAKLRVQISTEYDHKFSEERKKIQQEVETYWKKKLNPFSFCNFDINNNNKKEKAKFENLSVSGPLNSDFGSAALSTLVTSLTERKQSSADFAKPVNFPCLCKRGRKTKRNVANTIAKKYIRTLYMYITFENSWNWTCEEVGCWLISINCKMYITSFIEQYIDGTILLSDIGEHELKNDLAVKSMHCKKIIREIHHLKH
ncbi:hypothetical protein RFI_09842, partial [Reticulomyxa filosa]